MINTRDYLESAIAIRIMAFLGVISNEMPSIKNKPYNFEKNEKFWGGEVVLDSSCSIIMLYFENNDGVLPSNTEKEDNENTSVKYMGTCMISLDRTKRISPWIFIVVADETGKELDQNRVVSLPVPKEDTSDNNSNKEFVDKENNDNKNIFIRPTIRDMLSLVDGFESLRNYIPRLNLLSLQPWMLQDFEAFIKSISFE